MAGGDREDESVERTLDFLRSLRCPGVRRAEGTDEWKRSCGTYQFSPDLVAGRLRGNGDPDDFYIDVVRPKGDQFINPKAGDPQAVAVLQRAMNERSSFKFGDLGENYTAPYYAPLSGKLAKYAGARKSPLVGLVMYFRCDEQVGPILSRIQALRALDSAFGIAHHVGAEEMKRICADALNPDHSSLSVISLPVMHAFSFVLWMADEPGRKKRLFIVNLGVTDRSSKWTNHSVVKWLRRLAMTPVEILAMHYS